MNNNVICTSMTFTLLILCASTAVGLDHEAYIKSYCVDTPSANDTEGNENSDPAIKFVSVCQCPLKLNKRCGDDTGGTAALHNNNKDLHFSTGCTEYCKYHCLTGQWVAIGHGSLETGHDRGWHCTNAETPSAY